MTSGYVSTKYVPTKEEVTRFYDNAIPMITRLVGVNVHVGYWQSPEDQSTVQEATDRLTDMMAERLRVTSGQRVLDVGCGLGAPAIRLAKAFGVSVVGIATSANLIARATSMAAEAGLAERVTFELADAADLPFPDDSFDGVLAIESIVHMPDRPTVFTEIARVLRPGGMVALTDCVEKRRLTPDQREVVENYRRFTMNSPFLRLDEYVRLLMRVGLPPVEYLDISAQTARHQIHMMEAIERDREELAGIYGPEILTTYKSVFDACLEHSLPTYMLMAAQRHSA